MGPLLEDAVGLVVEDHEDHRDGVVRGGPEGLDGVHRAAVADQRDDRPVGLGQLHPEGGGQAPADAPAAQAVEAAVVARAQQLAHPVARGNRLVDDDRLVGHRARHRPHQREWADRGAARLRRRFLAQRLAARLLRDAQPLHPRAHLLGLGRTQAPPQRLHQLGQRRLRVALDRHLRRVVLADLPRVEVEVDERQAFRHRLHVGRQREGEEVAAHREQQVVLHEELADRLA